MKLVKVEGYMILWWNGSNGFIGSTYEKQRLHRTRKSALESMDKEFGEVKTGDRVGRVVAKVSVYVPSGESYERYS